MRMALKFIEIMNFNPEILGMCKTQSCPSITISTTY